MMKNKMLLGSLFAGIGGFDLAAERAGIETMWQCEIEKSCNQVLRAHWPGVERHEDVRLIQPEPVDVLCGGWPCQDLSVAGLRAGLAGERSGLFNEVVRVARAITPRWLFLENVPGLRSSWTPLESPRGDLVPGGEWTTEEESDLLTVLSSLVEIGYGVAWRSLDAQYHGLAQRRERVLIVGCLGSRARAAEVLFEPESLPWNLAPSREARKGIASSLTRGSAKGRGVNAPGRRREDDVNLVSHTLTGCKTATGRLDPTEQELIFSRPLRGQSSASHREDSDTYVTHALKAEGADASEDGTGRGTPIVLDMSNAAKADKVGTIQAAQAKGNKGYAVVTPIDLRNALRTTDKSEMNRQGIGVGKEGDPSPTLTDVFIPAIAYTIHGTDKTRKVASETEVAGSIRTKPPGSSENSSTTVALTPGDRGISPDQAAAGMIQPAWHENKAGQITPSDKAKAIRSGASHSYQGVGVRRLTPKECERLQGFPDDWTRWGMDENGKRVKMSDSARYRMLGNAVAVPVAEWVLRRIVETDGRQ